jgi:hypothetical protein
MSVRTVPYGREKAQKGDRVLVTYPALVPSKRKGTEKLVQGTAQWPARVVRDLGGNPGSVIVRWEDGGEEETVERHKCKRFQRPTDKGGKGVGITALHGPGAQSSSFVVSSRPGPGDKSVPSKGPTPPSSFFAARSDWGWQAAPDANDYNDYAEV